ncbi:hypothetical protein KM1_255260 [Entamoeba histolytica HM-3:IMSS]|uniref:Uncharacterized protein n=2 Tax=Entamoeba histolytica HM-3:IMSS TaxID=885315 RepID=M7VZ04_ENTHI|nr:hypothetical protein KM1_255260 [Entamoeba histolytica HM-3:IMSS]
MVTIHISLNSKLTQLNLEMILLF